MQSDKAPSTKERLATIVQGFDDFDAEMKFGTRQRREKDEFKIAELRSAMARLESELTAEIKRRTEMNKSTQMWFEQNLATLDKQFHSTLEERYTATNKRIDDVNDRITQLDEKFENDKAEILAEIDATGKELKRLLDEFKAEFEHDRQLRIRREESMVKQLTDHEHEVAERFQNQIESREAKYAAVRAILESNIKLRDKTEERFQTFYEKEVHQLHNNLRSEKEVREREDDEIVEALNRYTIKLQSSLKIINSTDM